MSRIYPAQAKLDTSTQSLPRLGTLILVTTVGSSSTKISAVICLTDFDHHECTSKTYLEGLAFQEALPALREW